MEPLSDRGFCHFHRTIETLWTMIFIILSFVEIPSYRTLVIDEINGSRSKRGLRGLLKEKKKRFVESSIIIRWQTRERRVRGDGTARKRARREPRDAGQTQ